MYSYNDLIQYMGQFLHYLCSIITKKNTSKLFRKKFFFCADNEHPVPRKMSFFKICQSSLIVTYLIRIGQLFFHWRGAIPLSFEYLWQKLDFHKVCRRASILTATMSNFTENYPFDKKTFWPTSNIKLEVVTIFLFEFWSISYKKIMFDIIFSV